MELVPRDRVWPDLQGACFRPKRKCANGPQWTPLQPRRAPESPTQLASRHGREGPGRWRTVRSMLAEAPRKRRGLSILGRDESSTPWTRVLRDHGERVQARERAYRCRGVLGRTRALGLSHLPAGAVRPAIPGPIAAWKWMRVNLGS